MYKLSLLWIYRRNKERLKNYLIKGGLMGLGRVLLCIIFPPLAVLDKGCGSVVIVTLLTCCGWVPGVIGALVINNK